MDPRFIDDLAQRLSEALPSGFADLQRDLESNFKSVLRSALGRLDLVTREEFDVQAAVLARTRERLKEFEARIVNMEARSAAGRKPRKKTVRKKAAGKKTKPGSASPGKRSKKTKSS